MPLKNAPQVQSLELLVDVPFELHPSGAIAAAIVDDEDHRRVGHAFYYPEQIDRIREFVDSETQFAIGEVPIGGEDYGYKGICLVPEGEEEEPPIIIVEGSEHVMDFVLNKMYPSDKGRENEQTGNLSGDELAAAIGVLSNLVTGDINYVRGLVYDVSVISGEIGDVSPVLLRAQMIQDLLSDFKKIEKRPVEIGLGSVRPNEWTLYVYPVDPVLESLELRLGKVAPTGVAVGPESIIRDFLCLSPTWVKQIGLREKGGQRLETIAENRGDKYFMLEVPYDEVLQLLEWLDMVCTSEDTERVVVDP